MCGDSVYLLHRSEGNGVWIVEMAEERKGDINVTDPEAASFSCLPGSIKWAGKRQRVEVGVGNTASSSEESKKQEAEVRKRKRSAQRDQLSHNCN